MLYTPTTQASTFCYSDEGTANAAVDNDFLRVAAAYVSSPYSTPSSPYYDFFAAHDVTLWTVNRTTRVAAPMRLDVVYTYVNPAAPSFERHLKARNVPFEPRRYRDWEELRYSLRSLKAFVLNSSALAQYHRRHAVDVRELAGLGYRVEADPAVEGTVVPLVRRVYLLVSDVDQVPAWLNAERFPQLRVVTHADLFKAEEGQWVLPTMNSNVIESGLHRIPDISRFFLYFTNDMLLGRKMSFFDLFRPLSPFRQRLHLQDMMVDGTVDRRRERVAMLFEPVVHSDSGNMQKVRKKLKERVESGVEDEVVVNLHNCLYTAAEAAITVGQRPGGWGVNRMTLASYKTTNAFSLPDPNILLARGLGVQMDYFSFIASQRLQGISPVFRYAHLGQLIDREVYGRMVEVELSDLINGTRAAYEREMALFGGINVYALFVAAMTRARERHLWHMLWATSSAGAAFEDVEADLRGWWAKHVVLDSPAVVSQLRRRLGKPMDASLFGALYGETYSATLQHPSLAVELAYWWVREAVDPVPGTRRLETLRQLYPIPRIAHGATCKEAVPRWTVQHADQYYSLLHDVFHHTGRDLTYMFEMIPSAKKALLVGARLSNEWVEHPLFLTFNDNFPPQTDPAKARHALGRLMDIVVGGGGPAAWER